eukprot:scaffold18486_cov44-Cyclotella_meneghiniana.AAC.1
MKSYIWKEREIAKYQIELYILAIRGRGDFDDLSLPLILGHPLASGSCVAAVIAPPPTADPPGTSTPSNAH